MTQWRPMASALLRLALGALVLSSCGGAATRAAAVTVTPSAAIERSTRAPSAEPPHAVAARLLAEFKMSDRTNGPEPVTTDCFSTRYVAEGYQLATKLAVPCATEVDHSQLGGPVVEAANIRVSLDVIFSSPPVKGSSVGVTCGYAFIAGTWQRDFVFALSPDGTYSVLRWTPSATAPTILASGTTPLHGRNAREHIQLDCIQTPSSVFIVVSVSDGDRIVATDNPSSSARTFGAVAIAVVFADAGFTVVVRDLQISELSLT